MVIKDDNVDCASARSTEVLSSAPRHATTLSMTARGRRAEVACRAAISCPVTRFQVLTPSPGVSSRGKLVGGRGSGQLQKVWLNAGGAL